MRNTAILAGKCRKNQSERISILFARISRQARFLGVNVKTNMKHAMCRSFLNAMDSSHVALAEECFGSTRLQNLVGVQLLVLASGLHLGLGAAPVQQAYLKASNTGAFDSFGAVAISGDTLVVGASGESSNARGVNGDQSDNTVYRSGATYVFVRNGVNWSQQAYLKASNNEPLAPDQFYGDGFGISVAISGDTIVVGANEEDSDVTGVNGNQTNNSASGSGAAYVFVRDGTNWTQQAYLKASNTGANDGFGISVAVSGDTIVVGSPYEDSIATGVNGNQNDDRAIDAGAAYVFVRDGTNWSQQAYLKASNTRGGFAPNGFFGNSVAVSADTIVVGAYVEDSNATGVNGNQTDFSGIDTGAAYVFARTGTNWSQQAYLKASNTESIDNFGWSVGVSGDTIVVGALLEDSDATGVNGNQTNNNATWAGAAYVFARSGTNWNQQAYLKASNTGTKDYFGGSVAVSADTVVIGASGESSSTTGVNGNQGDNSATNSGAAYVFVRYGTNWSQQAYLKASNTGQDDGFGGRVAISGDTVLVGAGGEDSNATGVNGNQANNSASVSGAAYVFTGVGVGPRLSIARDSSGGYSIRFNGVPDVTYRLQRAPTVTGSWATIVTQMAPASGVVEFHDSASVQGRAFYRTLTP